MSAVGTTLMQSPGCNEGKARNETLGTHGQKHNELCRSGTTASAFILVSCRCGSWLFVRWESVAPLGLFYALRFHRYKRKIGTREKISSAYFDF